MNYKQVQREAEEEARHASGMIVWLALAVFVLVVSLAAVVLMSLPAGVVHNFCSIGATLGAGLMVFFATAKQVRR